MASTTPKPTATNSPKQVMPLSDLLGALSQEFAVASASHHATMTFWKQTYENNTVLSDYNPAQMKVVSAQISIPVAVAQVTLKPPKVAVLTKAMIADALDEDLPKSKRKELANAIHADLVKSGDLSFANAKLLTELDDVVAKHIPNVPMPINRQQLSDLQRDHMAQPAGNSVLSLIYRTEDLEQVKPELVLRLTLELKLD